MSNIRKQLNKPIFYGLFSGVLFALLGMWSEWNNGGTTMLHFSMDVVVFGSLMGLFKYWTDKQEKKKDGAE